MKIVLKLYNELKTFETVKEAETLLNEISYYSESVELEIYYNKIVTYNNYTSLAKLMHSSIVCGYGYVIVHPIV